MADDRIQFQPGPSMPEFIELYGAEVRFVAAPVQARWAQGFRCPRCGSEAQGVILDARAQWFQCKSCRHQTALRAGTVMDATQDATDQLIPLHLAAQSVQDRAVGPGPHAPAWVRLSDRLAYRIHHKLITAMTERENRYVLRGSVQTDSAYLGGERSGVNFGRGSENKVPFMVAVSLTEDTPRLRVKQTPVTGFTIPALKAWSRLHLAPGCSKAPDGLACFAAVTTTECTDEPTVVGGRKPKDLSELPWINTVLVNLKTSLSGTCHAFACSRHAARSLAAFAYRVIRHSGLATWPQRLLIAVVRCSRRPEHDVRLAEDSC